MRSRSLFALLVTAVFAGPALAQAPAAPPPSRIRGTIEQFQDHTLTVKSREGHSTTVSLAPNFTVRTLVAKSLGDIKPGDKVGITSVKGRDGARQAIEIHIFPATMTTIRLGESPWDLGPDSLMTNAMVAEVSAAPQGRQIKVKVGDKISEINVPAGTPIVTYAGGDATLLKPGAAVFAVARKQPDGSTAASFVTVEKNGVKPPM